MKKIITILTFFFLYLPLLVLIAYSFNTKAFPAPWSGATLHWYRELFNSPYLWASMKNSLVIALSATTLSLTMATLLIFLRSNSKKLSQKVSLFYGNLMIPETILAVGLLSFFVFCNIPLGMPTLIVSHTVIGLGFAVPILYSSYLELEPSYAEASLDLGSSSVHTFFRITLPLIRPTLFGIGLLVFVISFDDFVISYFCSGGSVQTLSLYIFSSIRFGTNPSINALSTILITCSGILALIVMKRKNLARIFS